MKISHHRSSQIGAALCTALACLAAAGPACAAPLAHHTVSHTFAEETGALLVAGVVGLMVTRRHASRQA